MFYNRVSIFSKLGICFPGVSKLGICFPGVFTPLGSCWLPLSINLLPALTSFYSWMLLMELC